MIVFGLFQIIRSTENMDNWIMKKVYMITGGEINRNDV